MTRVIFVMSRGAFLKIPRLATRAGAVFAFALGLFACARADAQERVVLFDTAASGVVKRIPDWGLDTAWPSRDNMVRGIAHMGAERVDLVRVSFPVNAPLVNGELAAASLTGLTNRVALANLAGAGKPLSMTPDTEAGVDAWFKNGTTQVVPARWAQAMEATVRALQTQGKTLVSAAPFNEPDWGWNQGTVQNLNDILGLLQTSPQFAGVALAGPSTLSCDQANTWYEPIKARVQEGTTHQLGGTFDSYVNFYANVIASGDKAVNEEVHNLVEVIAGAEYGLATAVWWGTAERARGDFVKASDGARLGYAENRPRFSAAAVYRAPSGAVQAFLGSSERQGQTTTYRFVSRDRKVFFDGHGPAYARNVTINGDQDRVVNLAWGADVQPSISGRYVLVNRHSGKVLEVADASTGDGANIRQNTYTGGAHQQWDVTPFASAWGDQSYFSLRPAHSGKSADVDNFSHADGANVMQWSDTGTENQKWFFEYVGDGWFRVVSRWSGKVLEVAGASLANTANVRQNSSSGGNHQQWRLLPVGAAIEFTPPAAPTGLTATARAVSVALAWQPVAAADLAGYTVLRAAAASGPYEIIARGLSEPAHIDEDARPGATHHYVVRAADRSLNVSAFSVTASTTPTGAPALVARLAFEGDVLDASGNANHAEAAGLPGYAAGRVGAQAFAFDGTTRFLHLPPGAADHDALTVATWIYWSGGGAWQRVFDFGNGTGQYLFLTPAASGAGLRFAIKNGGAEQQLNAPALVTGQWIHVAVTLGGGTGRLYVNGVAVASSAAMTIRPSDFAPVLNYVGASQFEGDPRFAGRLDDFRLYNHALSASDVAALAAGPLPAPTGLTVVAGPEELRLAWSPVPHATSYTVRYATSAGGPYAVLASGLTTTSHVHAGATFGQTYFYVIEAENLGGVGAATSAMGGTPESVLITETERAAVRLTLALDEARAVAATVVVPASVPGHVYQLQHREDLASGTWTDLGAPLVGDGGEIAHAFEATPAGARVFYRVEIRR